MNIGTVWLDAILAYEQLMEKHHCLPLVESLTFGAKLQAMTLEQAIKSALAPAE